MEKQADITLGASLLHRSTQKFYDRSGERFGLGSGQFIFLITIYENEGITMKGLAAKGSFDKALVTKVVQKLEELGFVKIEVNPKDKRERFLKTTDQTKAIIKDLYRVKREWFRVLTHGMSEEEVTYFLTLEESIVANAVAYEKEVEEEIEFFGMQKITLLDYPEKVATTLFTGGCNMRCPFCHNSDLVFLPDNLPVIKEKEVLSYLDKRKNVVEGVCVSGGEPLLHDELKPFLKRLKKRGLLVKLDTNGTSPEKLKEYIDERLIDYVAMDIKNSKKKYAETSGRSSVDHRAIEQSIAILLNGDIEYEFRTTVVKEFHTKADIEAIGKMIQGAKRYYLQIFVDHGSCIQKGLHPLNEDEMKEYQRVVESYVEKVEIRG